MTEEREISLWRNYEENKVGVQIEGQPELLLTPDEARKKAERLEETYDSIPEEFRDVQESIVNDLREFADDVEE